MANKSKLSFLGGAGTVTGSNFLLEDEKADVKILVDCGFFQGCKVCDDKNREDFPYDPSSIDYLFITHAHIDHIGRIPKLVKDGFRGKIYSTIPTMQIAEIMLTDSMGILEKEAKQDKLPPIYTEEDVKQAMRLWEGVSYYKPINIQGGFQATFKDAGHILGSSMVILERDGRKIVFTGDLGNSPAPLLRDTDKISDVDYIVMESVYGDRNHESFDERKYLLEDTIEETVRAGGSLIVPAFSLERTQVLLFEINSLVEGGRIPAVSVYLDSPLAIKVTDIYKKSNEYFNNIAMGIIKSGDDIFKFPNLHFTLTTEESKAIAKNTGPKVIIAGSGMSNGGRIVHHERMYLPDEKNTLLLIGYQAAGTLGRMLEEGAKQVTIFGDNIPVRAKVKKIRGYSAHKDHDGLMDFISNTADTVEKVFMAMGEPKSALFLAQRARDYLGVNGIVPKENDVEELNL